MQRLIEQPTGDGEILDGATSLGHVHYHLAVYQQFAEGAGDPVPTSQTVEGQLTARGAVDLGALHQRRAELVLRLADGRTLSCSLSARTGTLRSTGRGLRAA